MGRVCRIACSLLTILVLAPALGAQKGAKEPKRPSLAAGSDTNDAQAYYEHGNRRDVPWDKSYDAYYWAYRLEPDQPIYLLARYNALWYRQSYEWRANHYAGAEFVVKSKEAKQIDSLFFELAVRDPFAHFTRPCRYPDWIHDETDPTVIGLIYYEGGCYKQAASNLGAALAKRPSQISLHALRAKAFYFSAQYDSAVYDLRKVIDSLRARDQKRLRRAYESKEMFEYMIGDAYVQLRNLPAAREAYGRALAENLAFYMAHAKLANVALDQNDLPTALAEFDQAVQLKADDGVLRHSFGFALLSTAPRRNAEAEEQFRKAIELEPHWAMPYFNLGAALENQGKRAEALEQYKNFLARVPRKSIKLTKQARARVTELSGLVTSP